MIVEVKSLDKSLIEVDPALSAKMSVQLKVNGPRGEEKIVDICDNMDQMKVLTVMELKSKIAKALVIIGEMRVVFRTKPLEDKALLVSYGIKHMSVIHTLLMLPGGGDRPA